MSIVLYKWPECWGLPSLSPACIQTEAYLRYAEVPFETRVCTTASKSPTGSLPALERDPDICGSNDPDEFVARKSIFQFLKGKVKDIDGHLSAAQKAQLFAFTNLVETKLTPATLYSTWFEPRGFNELKVAAYHGKLPFPLNHAIPWHLRRQLWKKYSHLTPQEVYVEAAEVLLAVADVLRNSGGPFILGARPTSLDALLAGHLAFYRLSLCAAPALANVVDQQAVLSEAVHELLVGLFTAPVPSPPSRSKEADGGASSSSWSSSSWSEAAKGAKAKAKKAEPTDAEKTYQRNSRLWAMGATAAIAAYILLSGRYVKVVQMGQDMLAEAAGGDDDDDDDEE